MADPSDRILIENIQTRNLVASEIGEPNLELQHQIALENVEKNNQSESMKQLFELMASQVPKGSKVDKYGKPTPGAFIDKAIVAGPIIYGCVASIMAAVGSSGATSSAVVPACGAALKQLWDIFKIFDQLFKALKQRADAFQKFYKQLPIATYSCPPNAKNRADHCKFYFGSGTRDCSTPANHTFSLMENGIKIDAIRSLTWVLYCSSILEYKNLINSNREAVQKNRGWLKWSNLKSEYKSINYINRSANVACCNGFISFENTNCNDGIHDYTDLGVDISAAMNCKVATYNKSKLMYGWDSKGYGDWFVLKMCFEKATYLVLNGMPNEEVAYWDAVFKASQITGGLNYEMVYKDECDKLLGIAINANLVNKDNKESKQKRNKLLIYLLIAGIILIIIYSYGKNK